MKPIAGKENPWIKSGQSVIFNESVDHGPFPLAQLKKLNLIPSMASIQTTLVNNEVSKPLFDMAKVKRLLRLTPALVTAEIPVPIFRSSH